MQALANTIKAHHIPAMRAALLGMLAAGADQLWPDIGVCGNVDRRMKALQPQSHGFCYAACKALAESWPHSLRWEDGTLKDYFVPPDYELPYDCGVSAGPLWEGQQLERRIDLMKHMLTQLGLLEQYYQSLKEEGDVV